MNARTAALLFLLSLSLGGCAPTGVGAGLLTAEGLRATSSLTQATLDLRPRTTVFIAADEQSADIYLTDLPYDIVARVAEGDQSVFNDAAPTGSIAHVHMFLLPRAGRTPIDFNANNFTVTQIVFAGLDASGDPAIGVYGGGGFLLPSAFNGDLEDNSFEGAIRNATLAFVRATPNFVDRLDGASVGGKLDARRDREAAETIARAIRRIANAIPRDPARSN